MVKKWRSCLSLLVSFAFILSMLFLDILEVEATNISQSFSSTIRLAPDGVGYGGSNYGIGEASAGTVHVEIPFNFIRNLSDYGVTIDYDKYFDVYLNGFDFTFNGNGGYDSDFNNVCIKDYKGDVVWTYNNSSYIHKRYLGSDIMIDNKLNYPFLLCLDIAFSSNGTTHAIRNYTVGISVDIGLYSSGYQSSGVEVHDTNANQSLDTIESNSNAIKDSTTNPNNSNGILGTIKNFFGGFFGWLKDLLLGLFIPDSDYFSTWFTNLNNLLSVKLGMLYAPFDLLITVLNAVYSSSTDFSGVPFPEIKWGDTVIIGSQNLTFSGLLGEHFSDIQGYVYFATDVVLLFAFLMLLQRKISLVLRGHESG